MSPPPPLSPKPLAAPRCLIVCTQRIGDVLLATPLARAIRSRWPDACIDFLVLPGTQGVLEGNPDIRHVHVFAQRVGWPGKLRQLRALWRKYDWSIATIASDRARLFAWVAAPVRYGFVHTGESHTGHKRRMLSHVVDFDDLHTHTVSMNLQLLQAMGLSTIAEVVPPKSTRPLPEQVENLLRTGQRYAVMHPSPKFPYKMWTTQAWYQLGQWLNQQGLKLVLTGSPDPDELACVQSIAQGLGPTCINAAGLLSFGQSTPLLERAAVYVGPDTAMTHMAAATGTPTIALLGPSNPVKWAPWPKGQTLCRSPWQSRGSQKAGNVWLIQGPGDCVPCLKEGCDRHEQSTSNCLIQLPATEVIRAASEALQWPRTAGLRG